MHKVISALKWFFGYFFFITIAVALVIYLWWFRVAPPFAGKYNTAAYISGIILFVIYGLTAIFWKNAQKDTCLRYFLLLSSVLWLLANTAYISWFKPSLVDSVNCKGTTYFVTSHLDNGFSSDWYYQITKWHGLFYQEVFLQYAPGPKPTMLICDENSGDIKIFRGNTDFWALSANVSDSKSNTYFDWKYKTTLGNLSYSLYSSYDSSKDGSRVRRYLLTICEQYKPETCKYIPIDHSSPAAQDEMGSIIADLRTNEIYILFDRKIYSAYGDETRKFDSITSNEQYSIAGYSKDNAYVYILFECDPSWDCNYIPFSFTTAERKDVKLALDENDDKTQRLSISIGNDLVFTYKVIHDENKCRWGCPESQCLVEGCTIPSQ